MIAPAAGAASVGGMVLDVLSIVLVSCVFLWPLLWPLAWAAWKRLPARWTFTWVAAALGFGALALFLVVVVYPLQSYLMYVAPEFQAAGLAYGRWLRAPMHLLSTWSYAWIPLSEVLVSLVLTRWLAVRWPAICAALRG